MPINQFDNYPLTWRPDKNRLTRPVYKSLIQQLEEDILSGKLQKNTRLPSQRELADFLDMNFTTVTQAYKYGIEKGLLYSNIGSGTFISHTAFNSITISTNEVSEHIIDFGLVSSFEECNKYVLPFIHAVSNQQNIEGLLNYQDPLGSTHQLSTAHTWLTAQGIHTQLTNIAIISGVQNGLAVTLAALFSPGDRIAIDRFTYSNFIELATLLHLEIVPIDFDAEGMLPDLLALECKKKKINGLFLMPSCNNPLGFQISLKRRQELANVIRQEQLWLIEDDIHAFLTNYFQPAILPPFQALVPEQTIYLAGMTKFICSGLRIAYLVFPEHIRPLIQRGIFNINVKTSGFDAEIITQILPTEVTPKILQHKYELAQKANELFDNYFALPRPNNKYPFHRTIPIKPEITQDQIETALLNKGIRIYHSNRFTTRKQKDAFIRVSLSSNNLAILDRGLSILKNNSQGYFL